MNVTRLVDASCRETDRAKSALIGIAGLEPDSVATAIDIVQHCAWAEPVGRGDSLHVRLGLDGDRLWIGPRFGGGDAGCGDAGIFAGLVSRTRGYAARMVKEEKGRIRW